MRAAVRNKLIDSVILVDSRVYEPHVPNAGTPKPYAVVKQGVDSEESGWAGFRRIIEVWPYVERNTFQDLDALEKSIKDNLDKQLLTDSVTGEVFSCFYIGTAGQEYFDEDWQALTRPLKFAVVALQAVNVTDIGIEDPWVTAIAAFTSTVLTSPTWNVYKNLWPLGYSRPCVMWRLAGVRVKSISAGAFEVRKKLIGHVISTMPKQEISGVMSLVSAIGQAVKIVWDSQDRRYMTVKDVDADYQADSLLRGQIVLWVSCITKKPEEVVEKMEHIYIRGELEG